MLCPSRALVAALALGALSVSAGGQPAAAADTVATVNGVEIDTDDLRQALEERDAVGSVSGDNARGVVGELITKEVVRQAVSDVGDAPTASELDDYPSVLSEAGLVDLDEVAAEYAEAGSAAGLTCAVAMLVPDDDTAEATQEALDEFDEPTIDDLVAVASGTGAQVVTLVQQAVCVPTATVPAEVLDPLTEAIAAAGVGQPTDTIELEGSLLIAMAPAFDEVRGVLGEDVVAPVVDELLAAAEISVAPRYGRWDPESLSVVPLSAP